MFSITSFSELMQCNKTVNKPNNRNYWNLTAHYRITKLSFRTRGGPGWWLMEPGQLIMCYKNIIAVPNVKKAFWCFNKIPQSCIKTHIAPPYPKIFIFKQMDDLERGDLGLAKGSDTNKMITIISVLWKANERERCIWRKLWN